MASFLILLVDDDDLNRDLVALYLEADGHRIIKAESGSEALALLEAAASGKTGKMPDVVLTDMQMPGMTGQELCQRIREKHYQKRLDGQPMLIGMSASQPPEEQLQQFDAFVSKPLDAKAFQKLVVGRLTQPSSNAVATEDNGGPLDLVVVEKLRKLMPPEALDELFSTYLSDTRLRLEQMEASARAGDTAEIKRCAHMMKGSAAMTGAVGIRRAAALLETTTIPLDQQRAIFDELRCACDAIEGTLARDARKQRGA